MKFVKYVVFFCACFICFICCFFTNEKKQVVVFSQDKLTSATDVGFNDDNFYACVVEASGKQEGTVLTDVDLSNITELICKNKKVEDITGIEKMTNLTSLNLMENNL